MKKLVRLRMRLSRNGKKHTYLLEYVDENGKKRCSSLSHSDAREAEKQKKEMALKLRMGVPEPQSLKLSEFWIDCSERTKGQVRQSTLRDRDTAMRKLIEAVGDIDCEKVRYEHGERFIQACLDKGNTLSTAYKEISAIKRVFQLAVLRDQLEKNPFRHLRRPKIPEQEIHVYDDEECYRLLRTARETKRKVTIAWELLMASALCTGMRRGELLNLTWRDVNFEKQTMRVAPKKNTSATWEWLIKDAERRTLPTTDDITQMLILHQAEQPEGSVYVFVPPRRYDLIQQRRKEGKWTTEDGRCPVNNFKRKFDKIRERASIEEGEFHDLRRTSMTRSFANGLTELDVMKLAGHSDFSTTHKFYVGVRRDLVDKARGATAAAMSSDFAAHLRHAPVLDEKGLTVEVGRS